METLQDAYRDEDDDTETTSTESNPNPNPISDPNTSEPPSVVPPTLTPEPDPKPDPMSVETADLATDAEPMVVELSENPEAAGKVEPLGSEEGGGKVGALGSEEGGGKVEPLGSEDVSSDSVSEGNKEVPESSEVKRSEEGEGEDMEEDEDTMEGSNSKKRKSVALDQLQLHATATEAEAGTPSSSAGIFGNVGNVNVNGSKKSSKKKSKGGNSVWTKPTSRKGKKKAKNNGNANNNQNNGSTHATPKTEDAVLVTPMPRYPDKNDDTPEAKICLSKVYKAEKVELGEDRLSAGSCKGYRMVRATRGVSEGAWFFEIKVVHLGESGHTRLGWSTEKGDLQAPVGYDRNSFGYRDIDGSKVHKALREKYGEEGYKECDVIGFYISLPEGDSFAPKAPHLVMYKGQKYVCSEDSKEEPTQSVPGSEISFFKNGVCQGVAFKNISGGHYYPAASMYTLPNQANCVVKFNFGPDFECFPTDFEGRPVPRPMIEVPYHGHDNRVENGVSDENKQ